MKDNPTTGVLLVNLGSPSAPTPNAVRAFLDEFLGDPMVVDTNRVVWWLVRKIFILPKRGRSSAELYRSIWTDEGSPLVVISKRQAAELARRIDDRFEIELAMRYGQPSIAAALSRLAAKGVERVRLFPMFPQWSQTTSGTIVAEAERVLAKLGGDAPALEVAPAFYEDAGYIDALAALVREHRGNASHLVMSLHGLPVRYIENGDPYQDHCERTARALAAKLELTEDEWTLAYQSRFGGEPWLTPDVVDVVKSLAQRHKKVAVLCPGFTADCLETIEEIGLRLTESFNEAGGTDLIRIPCLDTHPVWMDALEALCVRGLAARRVD